MSAARAYDGVYRRRRDDRRLLDFDAMMLEREVAGLDVMGFLTRADLDRHAGFIRRCLDAAGGGRGPLVDLGCGTGGYGRWLGAAAGLPVVGLDCSAVAVAEAGRRARAEAASAWFLAAGFAATALRTACAGAVVSLDALYLAPSPAAAMREVGRIVAPGAPVLFTVLAPAAARGRTIATWVQALAAAGCRGAAARDITGPWRRHMWRKHARRWRDRDALRQTLGPAVEPELAVSAAMLGLGGRPSTVRTTVRLEITAVRAA